MKLNYWKNSWTLDIEMCPCDAHFVEYLKETPARSHTIFHFGTGEHHIIAKSNLDLAKPNEILGITASREEHDSYLELIINNPAIANWYKVLFGDIYTLSPGLLPRFDLVTLFHLCEFYSKRTERYAPLDDRSLVEMFLAKLKPGGQVLFYKYSDGFDRAKPILRSLTSQKKLRKTDEYKSILFYTKA